MLTHRLFFKTLLFIILEERKIESPLIKTDFISKDKREKYKITDSLNILEEIKTFSYSLEKYRNRLTGDNIKIKVVQDLPDLSL